MQSIRRGVIFPFAVLVALAGSAHAQAIRTWVSGEGNDANPCSRTAPCQTFDRALSQTLARGEIDVLDPGDFGGLTITKAITIDGSAAGRMAGVMGQVTVKAGASDTVILRNLNWNGIGQQALAIDFQSGSTLVVENSTITAFPDGGIKLSNTAQCLLEVRNVQIVGTGINNLHDIGVNIAGANATVVLSKVSITNTNIGILSTPISFVYVFASDLIWNNVYTSGYYFQLSDDNHLVPKCAFCTTLNPP